MKFIIAPAKKMVVAQDDFPVQSQPQFRDQAAWLLRHMQQLTRAEAQTLWHTSEKLTGAAYEQLQTSDVTARQSPAIFSYVGIQYQYMAPDLLDDAGLAYIQQHLRILSGLYGILRPFDGIVPYRLEMQTTWLRRRIITYMILGRSAVSGTGDHPRPDHQPRL